MAQVFSGTSHFACMMFLSLLLVSVEGKEVESTTSCSDDAATAKGDMLLQTASMKHDASPSLSEKNDASPSIGFRRMDMMATLKIQSHSAKFFEKTYEKFDAKLCNGSNLDKHTSFMGDFADAVGSQVTSLNAKLDDSGYNQILSMQDVKQTATFIRRLAASCNMKVIDEGGLNGVAGYFTEEKGSIKLIKDAMFKSLLDRSSANWVAVKNEGGVTAKNAPLDVFGFAQVRALRQPAETIAFAKRMVEAAGVKIVDDGGFQGFMAFYSEPDDSQSLGAFFEEVQKSAIEGKWAQMK